MILKKSNWNSGKEKYNKPNKTISESLTNIIDQVEDRVSGLEDKIDYLEHLDNKKEQSKKVCI
jgi:hypothetical protein